MKCIFVMIDMILKNMCKVGLRDLSANKRKQKFRSKNYEGFCVPCKVEPEHKVWSWCFSLTPSLCACL